VVAQPLMSATTNAAAMKHSLSMASPCYWVVDAGHYARPVPRTKLLFHLATTGVGARHANMRCYARPQEMQRGITTLTPNQAM